MAKLSSTDIYGDLYVDGIISGVLNGSVSNNLIVKLNSGTTEGTNQFTFNGSAAKTINITPSGIGALSLSGGQLTGKLYMPSAATSTDASHPTQLAYGLLGAYGTLKVLGNTDTSAGADNEYVHIAAGWGLSPAADKGITVYGTYANCFGKKISTEGHNHTAVNRTCITTPIYNPNNGVLIDFNTNVQSGIMAIIKIYGNSYSSNPPIEAIYQFYDYADGDLMQQTGSAISGPAITLKVYKVDGKLKAWFQQSNNYCTFKVEVTYGNNTSTPNITLSNAAEPTEATQTITITPNRVYSAAYKPTPADIGAAASSHNHTSLSGITSLTFGGIDSSDTMSITTSVSGATSYMDFNMSDDANSDVWRWRFTAWDSSANANAATFNAMTLMATSTTKAKLTVNGNITADSFTGNASSVSGLSFWTGTQAQYDTLSSKSATTVYLIKS